MPRILVVGYNAWDIIVPWSGTELRDEKNRIETIYSGGGGPAATAALVLSSMGIDVKLLTSLAGDAVGNSHISELEKAGVDLALSPRTADAISPRAVIMVNTIRQARTIFWSRGELPGLVKESLPQGILDGIDLLYCDGHEIETAVHLAKMARERGLPVVLDAGSVRAGSAQLVENCTDVISSADFAPDLTGSSTLPGALERLRTMGPQRVGVTLGKYGVLGLADSGLVLRPAFAVDVLDTTGAGDVFHAGYTLALLAGETFAECLDWGNAAAAIKCQGWGGRGVLPTSEGIGQLLAHGERVPVGGPLASLLER